MNELARQYSKKGLVVLAINVDGDHDKYQSFVKKAGYSHLKWGRDSTGKIASSYRVTGVPTTYVLDHEGTVSFVHVGYGGGMKESLRQEIEELLAKIP